ncbi:hypothetical protein F5Y17DRAFT_456716 [Xylariaceae sp. FL0594]|nr:hypothetical protein F5Y17DRAFT_456716 [Xylariaceae sp. FL0594]
MRARNIALQIAAAAAISSATASHQRVLAHTASVDGIITPSLDMSNYSEIGVQPPPPTLDVVGQDKHPVGASIMGLIVFSAAGLLLL